MITALLMLYALGFGVFFVLHQMFDGGIIYPTRKEGAVVGFLISALWPLVALMLFVYGIFNAIKGD